jgi:hypothetical protein
VPQILNKTGSSLRHFLAELEALLFYFREHRAVLLSPTMGSSSSSFDIALRRPAVCKDGSLHVALVDDAPVYRLLLHACCQFHGFLSRSVKEGRSGSKVSVISLTRNQLESGHRSTSTSTGGGNSGDGKISRRAGSLVHFLESTKKIAALPSTEDRQNDSPTARSHPSGQVAWV